MNMFQSNTVWVIWHFPPPYSQRGQIPPHILVFSGTSKVFCSTILFSGTFKELVHCRFCSAALVALIRVCPDIHGWPLQLCLDPFLSPHLGQSSRWGAVFTGFPHVKPYHMGTTSFLMQLSLFYLLCSSAGFSICYLLLNLVGTSFISLLSRNPDSHLVFLHPDTHGWAPFLRALSL